MNAATPLLLSLLLASGARAQELQMPRASPAATLEEHIGLTSVRIEYGRPGIKGRKVFGGLVPYGEVWRTGANEATKITFGTDVEFGGADVPAGTYALFTIPGEKEWTVILNKVPGQWGAYAYDQKNDLARVTAKPAATAEPLETFHIGLTNVKDDSADLTISWERVRVPVKIQTDLVGMLVPEIEAAMAAEGKKPYLAAAMFYYEHGLDLAKATAWIDAAVKEQPDAMWIVYRKGLILAKAGNKEGARAAAQQAHDLATKAGGALGDEYQRLSEDLLASLK